MGHPEELPTEGLKIGDVASLLGVTLESLAPHGGKLDSLIELTEQLRAKNGEKWIRQHGDVIMDQWQIMLNLGI